MPVIMTYRGVVNREDCDEMGHMGMPHFVAKLSQAQARWREETGLGIADVETFGTSDAALNLHIRFHREAFQGDLIVITSGLLAMADRTMRTLHVMRDAISDQLLATFVMETGHLDLTTRKLAPWRDNTRDLAAQYSTPEMAEALPRGFDNRTPNRDISAPRATGENMFETDRSSAEAWECDAKGHMNMRFHLKRITDAQHHMWSHIGVPKRTLLENGFLTATAELRMSFLSEVKGSETLRVLTKTLTPAGKSIRFCHWMFKGQTNIPVAVAEGIGFILDKNSRKAVNPTTIQFDGT